MLDHLSHALHTFPVYVGIGHRRVRPLALAPDQLPPDLVPRIAFDEQGIRAGLPSAGRFGTAGCTTCAAEQRPEEGAITLVLSARAEFVAYAVDDSVSRRRSVILRLLLSPDRIDPWTSAPKGNCESFAT